MDSLFLTLEFELNSSAIAFWGDGAFDSGPRRNCKQHYFAAQIKLYLKLGAKQVRGNAGKANGWSFSPYGSLKCLPRTVFALFRWDMAVIGSRSHGWSLFPDF